MKTFTRLGESNRIDWRIENESVQRPGLWTKRRSIQFNLQAKILFNSTFIADFILLFESGRTLNRHQHKTKSLIFEAWYNFAQFFLSYSFWIAISDISWLFPTSFPTPLHPINLCSRQWHSVIHSQLHRTINTKMKLSIKQKRSY